MSASSTDRMVEALAAGIAATSSRRRGVSFGLRVAVLAACAALAAIAAGFLIAAAYMALAARLDPASAAALVGAGALALAGALVLGLWMATRTRRRRTQQTADTAGSQSMALLEVVADEVRESPQLATLAALVAGVVVGANPGLQDEAIRAVSQLGRRDG